MVIHLHPSSLLFLCPMYCLHSCLCLLFIHCLIVSLSPPSLYPGTVTGCRCVARVQAPSSSHPQVDSVALQPLQGRVGLAHPAAGHLHRHPDALLSRIPPQWPGGVHVGTESFLAFVCNVNQGTIRIHSQVKWLYMGFNWLCLRSAVMEILYRNLARQWGARESRRFQCVPTGGQKERQTPLLAEGKESINLFSQ